MRYCDECKKLNPKEYEQTNKKEPHICIAYGRLLFHRGRHPRIPTPDYCTINKGGKRFNLFKWLIRKIY